VTTGGTALPIVPEHPTLARLRDAAAHCRACDLWERGTQTVFGEGLQKARVLLVGEQPGDREDRDGRPFVGPAGQLLDRALEEAGIERKLAYVTNAVKHFKWEPRGKRRLHQKPNAREVAACRPWLDAELAVVKPEVVVALGATAAQALFGRSFRVTQERGRVFAAELALSVDAARWTGRGMATVHPSSILRAPDDAARREGYARFVEDLRAIAPLL
jgi:uracil-DNA glycosylase family protein